MIDIEIFPGCGNDFIEEIPMPETSTHHSKFVCGVCDRFIRWGKKPENEYKRNQSKPLKDFNYCEICLRYQDELKSGLTEHHIWAVSTNPELDNDVFNRLKLCTQCHTVIERIQEYCGTRKRKMRI